MKSLKPLSLLVLSEITNIEKNRNLSILAHCTKSEFEHRSDYNERGGPAYEEREIGRLADEARELIGDGIAPLISSEPIAFLIQHLSRI